ncbi:MAG: hypothetical protein Q9210_004245 [Variospora velana]
MIGVFPKFSASVMLPPRQLGGATEKRGIAGRPPVSTACGPSDWKYGCLLSPDDMEPLRCDDSPGFFEPTDDNWRASGAGPAYMDWTRSIDPSSPAWMGRISEPNFFAEKDSSVPAQLNLALMSQAMAHIFLWKHDDSIDRKCQILSGLVKGVIMSMFVGVSSFLAPAAIGAVAAEGAAGIAVSAGTSQAANILESNIFRSSPWTYVQNIGSAAKTYYKSSGASDAQLATNFASNFPTNVGGDALTNAICKHFPNAPRDEEAQWKLKIDYMIRTNGDDYRRMVDSTINDITLGAGFGDNGFIQDSWKGWIVANPRTGTLVAGDTSVLATILQFGEYRDLNPEQHRRFVTEPSLIEQDITKYFKNAIISTILKKNMCYIQCDSTPPKQGDASSFTPEDGRHCKARCWQNWSGEKELKLFGLDQLVRKNNEWDLDIQDFLQASYAHYKANRLGSGSLLPSVEELFEGKMSSTSGSFLPVCNSYMPFRPGQSSGIPAMCGDEYGSESTLFWKETNFAQWIQDKTPGDVEKQKSAVYLAKNDMAIARVDPVAYFMNMCNMGWHWPVSWPLPFDTPGFLNRGADPSCAQFKQTIDDWNARRAAGAQFPENQGVDLNCDVCYKSPVGDAIRSSQQRWIFNLFRDIGHMNTCKTQDYNFACACHYYRERAAPGSGCEVELHIEKDLGDCDRCLGNDRDVPIGSANLSTPY